MIRFLLPIIMVGLAGMIFFKFTDPILAEIDALRLEKARLNVALDNAKKLRDVEQKLLATYNGFPPEDLARLNKLVPDNVDNVSLIIDVNRIARPYGMSIRSLKLRTSDNPTGVAGAMPPAAAPGALPQKASVTLGFSVSGPYTNFQSFLADLARSLRVADVAAATFSSADKDQYDYNVEITTYWLK